MSVAQAVEDGFARHGWDTPTTELYRRLAGEGRPLPPWPTFAAVAHKRRCWQAVRELAHGRPPIRRRPD